MDTRILNSESITIFDTLKYAKRALAVGFTNAQAEFQAEEIAKIIDEYVATKQDIGSVKVDIEISRLELKAVEHRIIIKMGSMMVVAISLLATILKFF